VKLKTCLRCDWQGETNDPSCPTCGERRLYAAGISRLAEARAPAKIGPEEPTPEPASTASMAKSTAVGDTISVWLVRWRGEVLFIEGDTRR
jgi:hypothetical protein